jgi:myo-inositol-1(or 4)-monophosphatase
MSRLNERFDLACRTAREAGALALDYFNDFTSLTVTSKGVQDMASEADINTEDLIRKAVTAHFPEDNFLGEESAESFSAKPGAGTWIIDPIDGTQPFVNGIRSWCVAISFVEGTNIRLGVIFDPTSDELFAAQEGRGATLNGNLIQSAPATGLSDGLVCVGFSNRVSPEETLEPLGRLMHAEGMYHRNGSGALSLAYVAAGRLIGYFEPHMNSWDFSAGALMVREAGGRTNNCIPDEDTILEGGMMIAACAGVYGALEAVILGRVD